MQMRITPACAGISRNLVSNTAFIGDHPRVRGDKPAGRRRSSVPERITPACAGIRHRKKRQPGRVEDHPRVRGDKTIPADLPPMVEGSPPRARG